MGLTKFQQKSAYYISVIFFLVAFIDYIDNEYKINMFLFSAINVGLLYIGSKVVKETMIVGKAPKNKYNYIKD